MSPQLNVKKRFFTFNCGDISGWNVFCRCKCRNTLAQCLKYGSLLFPTVFVFLALLFHYILPVILLLTVYPWKISSAYIFLFSALLLYSLVSIYSSYNVLRLKTRSEETKDCIICLYSCLPILTLIFMMIPLYLFFILYAAHSSGGLSSTLFYFSPSLLLSVASWCMYQIQRRFILSHILLVVCQARYSISVHHCCCLWPVGACIKFKENFRKNQKRKTFRKNTTQNYRRHLTKTLNQLKTIL